MRQLDFTADKTGACAMPRPLTVKFDQIAVQGIGAKKETLIFYIDFSSTPTEQIKLEPAHLEFIGSAQHAIHRGKALYHAGDDCTNLFVVRSGSFKSVVSNATGLTHVVGFRMTGEVLGLSGLSTGRYACNAIALEDRTVCDVPLDVLESSCHNARGLQRHVHRLLSREIALEAHLMLLLGSMNTEQRLATFLLDLSNRLQLLGYSATEFRLRMTREDICSYLGLTRSTLQRGLTGLHEQRLIVTRGNEVRILDRVGRAGV